MSYTAEISRTNPTCFVFLIDQSGSMAEPIGGGPAGKVKADVVADALNRLLQSLSLRCAKSEGIRDYFHVGVIGYGERVGPALAGALAGRDLVPISEAADHPLRIEQRTKKVDDGAGGLVEQTVKFPIWFEPQAGGTTPMCQALGLAERTAGDFISRFPRSFPPIMLNLTDGAASDGNPEPSAESLRRLSTADGDVLLFNLHVSSSGAQALSFPDREAALPDDYARLLFRMSSVLPAPLLAAARREEFQVSEAARGFIFNADLVKVVQFLDVGTRLDTAPR
jgi:hypothetical protein